MKLFLFILILFGDNKPQTSSVEYLVEKEWHGTSICVDPKTDTACKDEEVIFVFKSIGSVRDTINLEAFKIIKSERISMGTMNIVYSQSSGVWTFELNARIHALWSFRQIDSTVSGTLIELPSKRLIRKVHLTRTIQ